MEGNMSNGLRRGFLGEVFGCVLHKAILLAGFKIVETSVLAYPASRE
jgi:hypothetical protein